MHGQVGPGVMAPRIPKDHVDTVVVQSRLAGPKRSDGRVRFMPDGIDVFGRQCGHATLSPIR